MMKNLLKNSAVLMLGELFTKMLSVLYLIPLIRINENIGILNATVTIPFGLFVVFGTLGINILLTSEITKNKDNPTKLRSCLIGALMLLSILSVLSALVLFIFAEPIVRAMISDQTYLNDIVIATRILSIAVILYAITAYLRTVITAFGHFNLISISYISEQIIKVLLIIIPTFILIGKYNMNVGVYAIILSIAIVVSMITTLILYLYKIKKANINLAFISGEIKISNRFLKHMLVGGVVILAASIYASVYEMIDITMMRSYLVDAGVDTTQNDLIRGIYFTSSWKIVFIPISISGGIITVMMTKIGGQTDSDAHHFDVVFNVSLMFGVISMLMLFGLGEQAFNILYSQASLGIIIFQALLIPFYITRNVLGTYVVSAGGKQSSVMISLVIMIISKVLLNLLFMNLFGYIGVVLSSIIAIILSTIYLYLTNTTIFNVSKESNILKLKIIIASIICGVILLISSKYFNSFSLVNIIILLAISIIVIGVMFIPIFKEMVKVSKGV